MWWYICNNKVTIRFVKDKCDFLFAGKGCKGSDQRRRVSGSSLMSSLIFSLFIVMYGHTYRVIWRHENNSLCLGCNKSPTFFNRWHKSILVISGQGNSFDSKKIKAHSASCGLFFTDV